MAQFKSVDKLMTELNNSEFLINHHEKASFSFDNKAAYKLIKKGKKAMPALYTALNDSTKNIAAHFVLCHIEYKHVSFAGPKIIATEKENIYKYYLGQEKGEGLIISQSKLNGNYRTYIEPTDLEKIKNYWDKIIKNKK